jgi:hypothetical protein
MTRQNRFRLKVILGYTVAFASALAGSMAAMSFALAEEQLTPDERIAQAFEGIPVQAPVPTPAPQQQNCMHHTQMEQFLANKFKESVMIWARSGANMTEFFVSEAGTWTAVVTTPDQMSCIVADGDAWTGDRPDPLPQSGPAQYRIEGEARPA